MMAGERVFATFFVDGHLFGVDVEDVQEVIRYQEMTFVPLAPAAVQGLINLRGQIVTAVDLRRRLDMQERAPDRMPMNVVIRNGDEAVSLLVDEIGDVLKVAECAFEEAPDTLKNEAREFIRGVYKLEDKLLLVLNTERAVGMAPSGGAITRGKPGGMNPKSFLEGK